MNKQHYEIILVFSTSHALRVESILGKAGIPCKLIPVPRRISTECGVCIRISPNDKAQALEVLETANVEIVGVETI